MLWKNELVAAIGLLCALSALSVAADEPAAKQTELLKTFRSEFVAITPGKGDFPAEFMMGAAKGEDDERPQHRVTIAHPFAIARFEVPQNLWEAVMGENPSRWKGTRNSVEMLSYDDAVAFCKRATEQMRTARLIGPTEVIRLPSEAEWEYSTRAGTKTLFSFGDDRRARTLWLAHWQRSRQRSGGGRQARERLEAARHARLSVGMVRADPGTTTTKGRPPMAPRDAGGRPASGAGFDGGSWKDKADRCSSIAHRAAATDLKDDAVGLRACWPK